MPPFPLLLGAALIAPLTLPPERLRGAVELAHAAFPTAEEERQAGSPLAAEIAAAVAEYAAEAEAWQRAGTQGVHPAVGAWPRFRDLVERGWTAGELWLIEHLERAGLPPSEALQWQLRLATGLLAQASTAPVVGLERILLWIAADRPRLAELCPPERLRELLAIRAEGRIQAAGTVLLGDLEGATLADDGGPAVAAEELWVRVARDYPGTAGARAAAERLYLCEDGRFEQTLGRWIVAWSDGDPATEPGPHPVHEFWPAFERLAELGSGRALWWMAREARNLPLDAEELGRRRVELLERLVRGHADEPWLVEAVQFSELLVTDLGLDAVQRLGSRLLEQSRTPELRAWVLHGLASLSAGDETDDAGVARAIELFERLQQEYPEDKLARAATQRLFALRYLRIGSVPPPREAVDGRGQVLRLSDLRGQVVVVCFWGYWSPACARELGELQQWYLRYAGEPFTVVGINTDDDEERARRQVAEQGLAWRHVFEGRRSGAWTQGWHIKDFPTYFLLGPDGRIRAKATDLPTLAPALEAELEALRAGRRR
jgi:peroxiredoxin